MSPRLPRKPLRPSASSPAMSVPDVPGISGTPAPATAARPTEPERHVATRFDHPFGTGFVVTLGVLAAILLGVALNSLSTVNI